MKTTKAAANSTYPPRRSSEAKNAVEVMGLLIIFASDIAHQCIKQS